MSGGSGRADWNRKCGSAGGLRCAAAAFPKHGRKGGGTYHPAVHRLNLSLIRTPILIQIASVDQHIVAGACAAVTRSGTAAVAR